MVQGPDTVPVDWTHWVRLSAGETVMLKTDPVGSLASVIKLEEFREKYVWSGNAVWSTVTAVICSLTSSLFGEEAFRPFASSVPAGAVLAMKRARCVPPAKIGDWLFSPILS